MINKILSIESINVSKGISSNGTLVSIDKTRNIVKWQNKYHNENKEFHSSITMFFHSRHDIDLFVK